MWAVDAFRGHPDFEGLTLAVPPETIESPPAWLAELGAGSRGVILVAGGARRTDSVRLGLESVPAGIGVVAVHDAARPLITREAITRVLRAVGAERGAVAGRRITDSLKEVDEEGRVVGSPDRERIWRAETPQAFPLGPIVDAYRRAESEGVHASDCAGLCQRYGLDVVMVEIDEPNPKITRRDDVGWVEAWIAQRAEEDDGTVARDAGRWR